MQGKDPFLGLLGLFILSTTFFFCGKGVVTAPPPVASENRATISPATPKISEPPPSSPAVPPVPAPMGLSGKGDAPVMEQRILYRINSVPLPSEGDPLLNRAPALVREAPTVVSEVGGHTANPGLGHEYEVLSEPRAQGAVEDLSLQRIAVDQPASNGSRMSRLVTGRHTEERRWQHQRVEWLIGNEGEQP